MLIKSIVKPIAIRVVKRNVNEDVISTILNNDDGILLTEDGEPILTENTEAIAIE